MTDAEWTAERRALLESALRKSQAAQQQGEVVRLTGQEGLAIYRAAMAWRDHLAGKGRS